MEATKLAVLNSEKIEETPKEKREKIEKILKERVIQYKSLADAFSESIDTYDSLIAVVNENYTRFKKYKDLILQFTETRRSFSLQRKNTLKALRRFEKILKNVNTYTLEQILETLKI